MLNPMLRCSVLLAALCATVSAQQGDREAMLRERLEKKLASPVFQANSWHTDLAAARAEADRLGKPLFVYFTRSYSPCAPCLVLERGALQSREFSDFAKRVVLYLHVTSRTQDQAEPELQVRVMGRQSWPGLAFLDADAEVLARQDGREVADFIATLQNIERRRQLASRAGDDPAAARELFELDLLVLRSLSFVDAKARLEELDGWSAAQRRAIDERMNDMEVHHLVALHGDDRRGLSRAMAAMFAQGRVPTHLSAQYKFWSNVLYEAEQTRDLPLFERGFAGLEKAFGDSESMAVVVDGYREKLREMRASERKGGG